MAKQASVIIIFNNGVKMKFENKAALNKHLRTNTLPSFTIAK